MSDESVPLTTDPDPDPAIFVSDFQEVKLKFFSTYYFWKVHLHHFSKIKSYRSHKTEEIRFLFLFLLEYRRFFAIKHSRNF
jgi:hypothetical protein